MAAKNKKGEPLDEVSSTPLTVTTYTQLQNLLMKGSSSFFKRACIELTDDRSKLPVNQATVKQQTSIREIYRHPSRVASLLFLLINGNNEFNKAVTNFTESCKTHMSNAQKALDDIQSLLKTEGLSDENYNKLTSANTFWSGDRLDAEKGGKEIRALYSKAQEAYLGLAKDVIEPYFDEMLGITEDAGEEVVKKLQLPENLSEQVIEQCSNNSTYVTDSRSDQLKERFGIEYRYNDSGDRLQRFTTFVLPNFIFAAMSTMGMGVLEEQKKQLSDYIEKITPIAEEYAKELSDCTAGFFKQINDFIPEYRKECQHLLEENDAKLNGKSRVDAREQLMDEISACQQSLKPAEEGENNQPEDAFN